MARMLPLLLAIGLAAPPQADDPPTAADGRDLEAALTRILLHAATPRGDAERIVAIPERAVNGYLAFQAADQLPAGLAEPSFRFAGAGQVTARATVDLDDLRAAPGRDHLGPLRYLGGRLPVTVAGVVQSADGTARVDIASVRIGSVPVPPALMAELIRRSTRSAAYPDGVDVTAPFPLPSGIDAIRIEPGRLVVVQ